MEHIVKKTHMRATAPLTAAALLTSILASNGASALPTYSASFSSELASFGQAQSFPLKVTATDLELDNNNAAANNGTSYASAEAGPGYLRSFAAVDYFNVDPAVVSVFATAGFSAQDIVLFGGSVGDPVSFQVQFDLDGIHLTSSSSTLSPLFVPGTVSGITVQIGISESSVPGSTQIACIDMYLVCDPLGCKLRD